jgi:hypothetical protein
MPRYYFDIRDEEDLADSTGLILGDLSAARLEAVRYSAEVLREMPERFWNAQEWSMTVRDSQRDALFMLKFEVENLTR